MLLTLAGLMTAVPAMALDLPFLRGEVQLSTSKPAYWRYELVDLEVSGQGGALDPAAHPFLEVGIYKDGAMVPGMPRKEVSLLRYDPRRRAWRGTWPIPWNPVLGRYEARLSRPDPSAAPRRLFAGPNAWVVLHADPSRPLASCPFEVQGRKPATLPPGFSVVTLEPGSHPYSEFPGVDGERRSWRRLLDWARFMHADAFWHNTAQTQVWTKDPWVAGFPWSKGHMVMGRLLAKEAKAVGLGYGAYVLTFLVGGEFEHTPYTFTTAYDRSTDSLVKLRFVSMTDPTRQRHLTELLKDLTTWPGMAYIGLDYVRCDRGGLEMVDDFLSELGLEVPDSLRALPAVERQRWLGRLLALDQEPGLEFLWDWWRAHRVSLVLKGILEEAKVTQPLWVFSLGWKQGHQHGQDLRMLIDAGISFNSPMFYEADQHQHAQMLEDWAAYLKDTRGTLVFGQPVDSQLLRNTHGANGPEEHYARQLQTLATLGPRTDHVGFFWHDLNRALAGGRGASTMREWALAGAASFSRLREASGALPLGLEVGVPAWPGLGHATVVTVTVQSLTSTALTRVRVEPVWSEGLSLSQPSFYWVKDLPPGQAASLTFAVRVIPKAVKARYQGLGEERMVAFRARAFPDRWKRPSVAFKFWKEQGQAAPEPQPAGAEEP